MPMLMQIASQANTDFVARLARPVHIASRMTEVVRSGSLRDGDGAVYPVPATMLDPLEPAENAIVSTDRQACTSPCHVSIGACPSDLDLHLIAPLPFETQREHHPKEQIVLCRCSQPIKHCAVRRAVQPTDIDGPRSLGCAHA